MEPSQYEALVGTVLKGTYRVERLLGQGGMGAVFAASHARMSRPFVIKVLSPLAAGNAEAVARFQREAEVTSRLGHPHIVKVFDFDHTEEGAPYIVMELLEGEDLGQRLQRVGRLELEPSVEIVSQAARALGSAHAKGIVHRDLKPENLFLCRLEDAGPDFVKVVDFGISKVLDANTVLTSTSVLIGTPHYMSPEQADERAAEVDQRADVYALGTILYTMLAGHPPLTARSVPTLLYKIVHEQPPPLREVRPDLPTEVEAVVQRAMSKEPGHRFASMQALVEALDAALGRSTPDRSPDTLPTAASKPTAASGGRKGLIALAALLLLGGVGVMSKLCPGEPRPAGTVIADLGAAGASPGADASPTPADAAARSDARVGARTDAARAMEQPPPRRPRRRKATLQIQTLYEGQRRSADIYLNGKQVGQSPLYKQLRPGRYVIRAELRGYGSATVTRRLAPGETASVVLGLQKKP